MNVTKRILTATVACAFAASAFAQIQQNTPYYLKNVNSGLAVNVSGASTTNGAKIIQWPYDGNANSVWTFVATSNGYYQIKSENSGSDIAVQNATTTNGAKLIQWTFGAGRNDQWKPVQNSDGSYSFFNLKSGLVMEVPGNSTAQGTQLDQWGSNGGANQKFTVNSPGFSGWYQINDRNSGSDAAVHFAALTNGADVILYTFGSAGNDVWQLVATDSGYYKIVNFNSGKVMAVKGASTSAGAKVIQWDFGTAQNDQWMPVSVGGGYYKFVNRHSGLVLDVTGGGTSNGTTFDQAADTGVAYQQFKLISTPESGGGGGGDYTASQVLSGIKAKMTSGNQVNTLPHINTMTRQMNVNVYKVGSGVFAYTSGMAIDDDGIDPDPDPDHQSQTTWQDDSGRSLGAHHVAFYVLGDDCWDNEGGANYSPCPHFFYAEHNITGLQFALIFYNGNVIGAVFGDTQTANNQTTSDNDARELGEASVHAASMLGIPSSGTTGGVDNGVTVTIFSGSSWVVHGSDSTTINNNAQALIQKALNTLGPQL
ncbi:MAG TPA: RICIN domain-containing protein [Desulfuromonadaceae bacterium]|nr:RICIN domain-containing protein [Desulfuromonadaceae bacterium]